MSPLFKIFSITFIALVALLVAVNMYTAFLIKHNVFFFCKYKFFFDGCVTDVKLATTKLLITGFGGLWLLFIVILAVLAIVFKKSFFYKGNEV